MFGFGKTNGDKSKGLVDGCRRSLRRVNMVCRIKSNKLDFMRQICRQRLIVSCVHEESLAKFSNRGTFIRPLSLLQIAHFRSCDSFWDIQYYNAFVILI